MRALCTSLPQYCTQWEIHYIYIIYTSSGKLVMYDIKHVQNCAFFLGLKDKKCTVGKHVANVNVTKRSITSRRVS